MNHHNRGTQTAGANQSKASVSSFAQSNSQLESNRNPLQTINGSLATQQQNQQQQQQQQQHRASVVAGGNVKPTSLSSTTGGGQQLVATSINTGRKKSSHNNDKYVIVSKAKTVDADQEPLLRGPASETAPVTPRRKMGFFMGAASGPTVAPSRLFADKRRSNSQYMNEKSLLLSSTSGSSLSSAGLPVHHSLSLKSSNFNNSSGRYHKTDKTVVPIRYMIIAMSALATCVSYTIRVNMSVTLVAMVNQSAHNYNGKQQLQSAAATTISSLVAQQQSAELTTPSLEDATQQISASSSSSIATKLIDLNDGLLGPDQVLNWSESMQGIALGAFYWGFIATHVFGGQLANMFSARKLCAGSLLTASLLTLVLPLAANHSVHAVVVLRVITGLCLGVVAPAMFTLMSRWVPQGERSTSIAIRMIGGNMGAVTAMSISGYLSDFCGWESVFYVIGGFGVVVFCLWMWVVDDSAAQHPWVSSSELEYIRANSNCMSTSQAKSIKLDWISMIISPRLWAVAIAKFCGSWGNLMLMQKLPSYLESVLELPIAQNGVINALIYISLSVSLFAFGCLSDYLCSSSSTSTSGSIKSQNRTLIRKMFEMIALCGPSICLASVPFVGQDQSAVIGLLTLGMILYGMSAGGDNPIVVEMAPDFSGTLYGVTNAIASIPGFLAPIVVGFMLDSNKSGNQDEWNKIFFITAAIYAFGAVVFLAAATTEPQPWGLADFRKKQQDKKQSCDKSDIEQEEMARGMSPLAAQSSMMQQSTTILVDPFQTTYESSVCLVENSQRSDRDSYQDYGTVSPLSRFV